MNEIEEKILNILKTHYQELDPIEEHRPLFEALDELYTALGACPHCWGRGYTMSQNFTAINFKEDGVSYARDIAIAFCQCERGVQLQRVLPKVGLP